MVDSQFPWAHKPLLTRIGLTVVTAPIVVPLLMAMIAAVGLMLVVIVMSLPLGYLIAGVSAGKPEVQK